MGLFKKPRTENMEPLDDFNETPQLEMYQVKTPQMLEEEKWEQRRWELTRCLVAQDRRSVVLGKLNASEKQIARKARLLTDATIDELRKNDPNGSTK